MFDEVEGARATVSEGAVGGDFEAPRPNTGQARQRPGRIRYLQPEEEIRCRPAAGAAGRHKPNNGSASSIAISSRIGGRREVPTMWAR
jgi:hypothetical protein